MTGAAARPVVVVGSGVVGLAVARSVLSSSYDALAGRDVYVLEHGPSVGAAHNSTSARNSEVVHAGIYYPEGSLKAACCVAGRRALYDYCDSRGVEYKKFGKLVVATHEDQHCALRDSKSALRLQVSSEAMRCS